MKKTTNWYFESAVKGLIADVQAAKQGGRHKALTDAACRIGQLAHLVSREAVETALDRLCAASQREDDARGFTTENSAAALESDPLLTSIEAAALLRRTPATLARWRAIGIGPEFLRSVPGEPRSAALYRASAIRRFLDRAAEGRGGAL
jgi:hypothetical protein